MSNHCVKTHKICMSTVIEKKMLLAKEKKGFSNQNSVIST